MKIISVIIILVSLIGCAQKSSQSGLVVSDGSISLVQTQDFNADSAYSYIQKQVSFGPRVPETKAHALCADYLANKLEQFGADVRLQEGEVNLFTNQKVRCVNIIGQYQKENPNRIVLFSHWDSRPFADMETDEKLRNKPIDGASDGASGVGVLLEIARNIQKIKPNIGVDIIFLDVEDYGQPSFSKLPHKEHSWCLGAQFWANNLNRANYSPRFGILLDMVGAKDAQFYKEGYSVKYAPDVVERVWKTASLMGYGNIFVNEDGGTITDDHLYVNAITGIPTIDIIQYDPQSMTSFGTYWHTHQDTMDIIDRGTLDVVGDVLMQVLYSEQ